VPTRSDLAYFDASALHKLVVSEAETPALRVALTGWRRGATSRLAVVELIRSVRRASPDLEADARWALTAFALVNDSNRTLMTAAEIHHPTLRALDAIHVATAFHLRPILAAFVSYDERQLEAAEALGLPTASPR
jgi:predicted nucleic acid-binding protein